MTADQQEDLLTNIIYRAGRPHQVPRLALPVTTKAGVLRRNLIQTRRMFSVRGRICHVVTCCVYLLAWL